MLLFYFLSSLWLRNSSVASFVLLRFCPEQGSTDAFASSVFDVKRYRIEKKYIYVCRRNFCPSCQELTDRIKFCHVVRFWVCCQSK